MKWLSNTFLLLFLGGLIVLSLLRLSILFSSVPTVIARVNKQQASIQPAQLNITVIADGTCSACTSPQPFLAALQKQGAAFSTIKQIDGATEAGQRYLAEQKIERFPAVVIQGETSRDDKLEQFLTKTSVPGEGKFIYSVPAPYHEVTGDKLRGLFRTVYLTNPSCSSCYDVTRNAEALKNLGVTVVENKTVTTESLEGQELIKQYKIRYLPTVILIGDLEVYPAWQKIWPEVGTKEPGGTYILRDGAKLMGTYYDWQLKRALAPETNTPTP